MTAYNVSAEVEFEFASSLDEFQQSSKLKSVLKPRLQVQNIYLPNQFIELALVYILNKSQQACKVNFCRANKTK